MFVIVKNVTPIPLGAEPTEYSTKWRKDGFRTKYLLEKTSEGWKVSQVYRFNENAAKFKIGELWDPGYKFDDRPRYPSYVPNH